MENHTKSKWPPLIGAYIMNFGAVEVVLLNWIGKHCSDKIVRDLAIDMPLHKRLSLVRELIKRSDLPEDQKHTALLLWCEVEKHSKIRNIIAHNPFITHTQNGREENGFIDVKKMKGIGPYPLLPLSLEDIAKSGSALAKILPKLIEPLSRNPTNAV